MKKWGKVSSEKKIFQHWYVFTASISVEIKSQKQKYNSPLCISQYHMQFSGVVSYIVGNDYANKGTVPIFVGTITIYM